MKWSLLTYVCLLHGDIKWEATKMGYYVSQTTFTLLVDINKEQRENSYRSITLISKHQQTENMLMAHPATPRLKARGVGNALRPVTTI